MEPASQGQALVLRFVPWADQSEFPDWSSAAFQTIFANVQSVVLRYEDPRQPSVAQAWVPIWQPVDELPSTISIALQGEGLLLEMLVVPMRLLPASDPRLGGDGTVVGGQ
jgi:general secretion pathway protein J